MNEEEKTVHLPLFGLPKVVPYLKGYRKHVVVMILLGALSSLIDSAYPLFNRYALDHYVGEGTLDTAGLFAFLYILVLVVQVVANYLTSYNCCYVELGVGRDLKNEAFRHLQTLSFSYFNQNSVAIFTRES